MQKLIGSVSTVISGKYVIVLVIAAVIGVGGGVILANRHSDRQTVDAPLVVDTSAPESEESDPSPAPAAPAAPDAVVSDPAPAAAVATSTTTVAAAPAAAVKPAPAPKPAPVPKPAPAEESYYEDEYYAEEDYYNQPYEESAPAAAEPSNGGAGNDQLSQLLVSRSWCSFSYNSVSGGSSTSKYTFGQDGQYYYSSGGESYSSGYGGTAAGQSSSSSSGQWKVQGQTLYIANDQTGGQFVAVQGSIKYNSNGSPIIVADGTEFSGC